MWCRHDRNCKFKINNKNVFIYDIKMQIFSYLQLKHYWVNLHGLDMGDTYTNSIIKSFFKAQNELYHMTYAVKTVENLFTGCGHERNTAMMETDFFFIKSIIKS